MEENEKEQPLLKQFQLEGMLAIYYRDLDHNSGSSMPYYMEMHKVEVVGGKPVLGSGAPLSASQLDDLKKMFVTEKKHKAPKPELIGMMTNVIYCNLNPQHHVVVWRVPAHYRQLYFRNGKLNGKCWTPDLIFVARDRSDLSVFAIDGKGNLYDAPYPNVYEDATVCLGDCTLTDMKNATTFEDYRYQWERIFFDSKFSEGVSYEKKDMKLIQSLIKSRAKFPVTKLRKFKEQPTLKSLLASL